MDSSGSPIHITLLSHLEVDGKYTLMPCISAKKENGQYAYYLYSEKSGLFQHNADTLQQLENLGFSRVVLSRELSLNEIEYIRKNTSTELEVFIHGALCISYSGQCLLSSIIGGRSR